MPLVLYPTARILYRWWIHWEVWYPEQQWTLVEIIPPAEILKPSLAMEDLIGALWSVYDSANWREIWCEGELDLAPFWISFEVVSIGGQIHYYLRILKEQKKLIASIINTHYPDAEIIEVPDYTKDVPQDVPNKDYDIYGEDYVLLREDSYPIRTYKFFEIRPEEIDKEKKLDPVAQLLEAMAKLKEGEQFWFQMILAPITNDDVPWVTEGRAIADKIARRVVPEPVNSKTIVGEAFRALAFDKVPYSDEEAPKEEEVIPPEMKLTPGEREILAAVEEKISKYGFKTTMRAVYIYKRDAQYRPHGKIARSYIIHFNTLNLNGIRYFSKTRTKIHYFFRKRRLYTRKKNIFERYVKRLPPLFPATTGPGTMILNAEEIAAIFHFPMNANDLPSSIPRVAAKKVGPPPGIPTE